MTTEEKLTEAEMASALEQRGFVREFNGGGTHVYRRKNQIVSGFDGDLPSPGWFQISVYRDWDNDPEHVLFSVGNCSAEESWRDLDQSVDFVAALDRAEWFELVGHDPDGEGWTRAEIIQVLPELRDQHLKVAASG